MRKLLLLIAIVGSLTSCTINGSYDVKESEELTTYHNNDLMHVHCFKNQDSLYIFNSEIDSLNSTITTNYEIYKNIGDYYQLKEKVILINDLQTFRKVYNNSSVKINNSLEIEQILNIKGFL